jgi:hypothetical protein
MRSSGLAAARSTAPTGAWPSPTVKRRPIPRSSTSGVRQQGSIISIMAPIPDPRETPDLQVRTAWGSTILAFWGQPCARLASSSQEVLPQRGTAFAAWLGRGHLLCPLRPSWLPRTPWLSQKPDGAGSMPFGGEDALVCLGCRLPASRSTAITGHGSPLLDRQADPSNRRKGRE